MTTAIQFNVVDALTNEYILPSTLAMGLKALYFFDRGLIRTLTNLAPGGVQGATFSGAPTINGDGTMTFLNNTVYMQTPIMETVEATALAVVYSNAPLAGENSVVFSNDGADTSRSPIAVAGMQVNNLTASTPPDGKLSCATFWGATGTNPPSVLNSPLLDIPQWRTPSLLYVTAGTTAEKAVLGSLTLGASASTPTQTGLPRFINFTNPFRIGAGYAGITGGQVNIAMWAYYNRILSGVELTAFRAWIGARLLRKYGFAL